MKSSGSELGRRRQIVINIKGRQAAFNDCCCETFWNLYLHIYILINTVVILSQDQKAEIPWDSTALAQVIARFALNA